MSKPTIETDTFQTPQGYTEEADTALINPVDVFIVSLILLAWFAAITLFLHQWGKLRIMPDQPRFNCQPKNIETIKVVENCTDSVIHNSYSSQHTKTRVAREKRHAEISSSWNSSQAPGAASKASTQPGEHVRLEEIQGQMYLVRSATDQHGEQTTKKKFRVFGRRQASPKTDDSKV